MHAVVSVLGWDLLHLQHDHGTLQQANKLCVVFVVSVLETEKSLVLAEKGSGDNDDVELIRAAAGFRLVATMNPGGDFGKKEVKKRAALELG